MDRTRQVLLAVVAVLSARFLLSDDTDLVLILQEAVRSPQLSAAAALAPAAHAAVVALAAQAAAARVVLPPRPRRLPALRWQGPGEGFEQAGAWVRLLKASWERHAATPGALADVTDQEYINLFRVDQATFWSLCNDYGHHWERQDTRVHNTVSRPWRLAIFLSWMAFGFTQRPLATLFGVSDTLVSDICNELTAVFSDFVYRDHVRLPTKDQLVSFEAQYRRKYKLPNCIGSVDGSFFHILQPAEEVSAYFCYKKYYAILVLAVVDPSLKFRMFQVCESSSSGDAAAWNASSFHRCLHQTQRYDIPPICVALDGSLVTSSNPSATTVDSYIVADSAFALTRRCMKIYANDQGDADKVRLNDRITAARQPSELAFGRYSGRWKIVKWNKINNPRFATQVAKAAAALHNICEARRVQYSQGWERETDPRRIQRELDRASAMRAELQRLRARAPRPVLNPGTRNSLADAERVRAALLAYTSMHG